MGGRGYLLLKYWLLCCLSLCFALFPLGTSSPVHAQEGDTDEDEFVLEEIVVTGSRIVRRDFESISPIVTVDETLFDHSATLAIETQLNKLPQFRPTMDTPEFGGDIQPNARNTPGEATISLRGLGSNRSLVLINGRRATPANAQMYVDINTIPVAAIERVEAISGGASSTYGADAMAGVVNFIMRERFVGLELDGHSGITQEGDNFEYQVSGIMGTDFADDRGNISIAFSYNDRNDALQRDRDWYRDLWANPSIGGTQFFSPFSGFSTGFSNLPDVDVVNTVIDGATFTSIPTMMSIFDDGNGNAFTGFGYDPAAAAGVSGADIVDGYRFKLLDSGLYGVNNIDNYLIFPLERYNMYTRGNYEINDWIGVFADAYFSKTSTVTVQEPVPIVSGLTVNIDPTINRDVIPSEILAILDSRPSKDAPFELNAYLPFNRGTETDVFTYNLIEGLEGTIPGSDWTWELFLSQGEAETTSLQAGLVSLQRLQAVMSAPNFGQGFSQTGNLDPPNYGFGAATATCTSGLNPFDWSCVTQDCWDAVKANVKTKQLMEQTIWEANLQGAVVELPAGGMRAAVGASTRKNEYEFQNDTLVTQGTSFLDQASSVYPASDSEGSIEAKEVYGELLVPVLSDLPFIKNLNLELGGRRSDYDTTGTSYTYKALVDWRTKDWIRVRGGYNRPERAPNVAELFLAPEQTFGAAFGGDVCSTANLQAWSANKDVNPEHWQEVVALCGELMRAAGNPNADSFFYGIPYEDVVAGTEPTTPQAVGMSWLFPTTTGNPNLSPEEADTWTAGVVIDSPLDHPWLSDWRISLDWYNIKVYDAIGEESPDIVMRKCVDPAFNPTLDPSSPYCTRFGRNQVGMIGNVQRTFYNSGRFETSGIDFNLNWSMDAGPGRVGVNSLINYLIEMKSAELDILPMVDYAGTFGPGENGLNGNSYRWRALTEMSYSFDALDLRLAVRWQYRDSIGSGSAAVTPDTPIAGVPPYHLFDLLGNYGLTEKISLRFGIENVFNKKPPLTEVNPSAELPSLTGGMYNYWNYDTNGRRFYAGARVNF